MKKLAAVVSCTMIVGLASAGPNRLPVEEAQRYAKLCLEHLATLNDLPLKTEVDPKLACAERGEGGGAMVIPDNKLTAKTLIPTGDAVTPIGQLWLRKWTLVVAGKAIPNDRLRIIPVKEDGKDRPMPLFLLGVRKKARDIELVVYAREGEPVQTLKLNKVEGGQDLPLDLDWKRGDKEADSLTLSILGKYQGVLRVGQQEK